MPGDLLLLPGVTAGVLAITHLLTGPPRAVAAVVLVTATDAIFNRRSRS